MKVNYVIGIINLFYILITCVVRYQDSSGIDNDDGNKRSLKVVYEVNINNVLWAV